MGLFVLRRLLQAVPVLWVIATVVFFMVRLTPGGPFDQEKAVHPRIRANLERHYGLDDPLAAQYVRYLGNLLRGDLGPSFKYLDRSVNELIAQSFPVSFEVGMWAFLIALALGLPAGVVAAWRKNTWLDYGPMSLAMAGICLPSFVLGPILILVFALRAGWFNPLGWSHWSDRFLPSLTLGLYYAAYFARLARAGMLETLSRDYIRAARAKGLPERRVVLKHALKGGILPLVAYFGPALAGIISGSFVVETIFFLPGLGRHFVNAAFNRDYTMVLGTVMFYAALLIALNLAADIIQVMLNPRLRYGKS